MENSDMDGGMFRASRSADQKTTNKSEPKPRLVEETRTIVAEPKTIYRTAAPQYADNSEKSFFRFFWPALAITAIVAVCVTAWLIWGRSPSPAAAAIDNSKYQAVFFTNGQVYFGKLKAFNHQYMKLTEVFYLQSNQPSADSDESKNPQETSTDQGNVQLIKLGDEIHGPEDEMVISKDQLLFFENLKPDGKVAQSIEKYKSTQ